MSAPDAGRVIERLRTLDTLVVSDFFVSETAALADVVLPAAQWAEEEGTMTNLEGRVIRRRRASTAPEGVRTDLQILSGIAAALGRGTRFRHQEARAVFDELRRASSGGTADYSGITYERIDAEDGVFWPLPERRPSRHAAVVRIVLSYANRAREISRGALSTPARSNDRRLSSSPDDWPVARALPIGQPDTADRGAERPGA